MKSTITPEEMKASERAFEEKLMENIRYYDRLNDSEGRLKAGKMLCYNFPDNELAKILIKADPDYFKGPNKWFMRFLEIFAALLTFKIAKTAWNAQKKINSDVKEPS